MKKKALSLVLAFALLLSLTPALSGAAAAADDITVYVSVENAPVNGGAWTGSLFDGTEHNGYSVPGGASRSGDAIAVTLPAGSTAQAAIQAAWAAAGMTDKSAYAADYAPDTDVGSGKSVGVSDNYIQSVSGDGLSQSDPDSTYWAFTVFPYNSAAGAPSGTGVQPGVGIGSCHLSDQDTVRLLYTPVSTSTWAYDFSVYGGYTISTGSGNTAGDPAGFGFTAGSVSVDRGGYGVSGYTLTLLSGDSPSLTKLPGAEPGDTVTVYDAAGQTVGTDTVGGGGSFSISMGAPSDGAAYQMVIGQYRSAYAFTVRVVSPETVLSNTVGNYYQGGEGLNADLGSRSWQTVCAVYAAALGGGGYGDGALLPYSLPDSPGTTSDAALTIYALITGDMDAAQSHAENLAGGGALANPGYAYGLALNMLAVEAYNRAAGAADGYAAVSYDKAAAVSALLGMQDDCDSGTSGDIGYCSAYGGTVSTDLDSSAMALTALSLYTESDCAGVTAAADSLKTWMRENYAAAALSDFYSPANTAACLLWAISAVGDNVTDWRNEALGNPLELMLSYSLEDGGFYFGTPGSIDAGATDQATLALADYCGGRSLYTQLTRNPHRAIGDVTVYQVGGAGGINAGTRVALDAADTLADVMTKAGASGSCYAVDGSTVTKRAGTFSALANGMVFLAVPDTVTGLLYFQADGETAPGASTASAAFGGSADLTLVDLTLPSSDGGTADAASAAAPVPNCKVTSSGGALSGGSTDSDGKISLAPVDAQTTVTPYVSYTDYYSGTTTYYVDANGDGVKDAADAAATCALPATVRMASGSIQSKTVSVRVEGPTANVLYYPDFTVQGSGASVLTAADAVCDALGEKGISYDYSSGYLSSITLGGTTYSYNEDGAGSYWSFAYNDGYSQLGMGNVALHDGDSIVVYWTNAWGVTAASLDRTAWDLSGDDLTATVRDAGGSLIAGAAVTLSLSADFSGGVTAVSGADGVAAFDGLTGAQAAAAGTYYVRMEKVDGGGSPQILRLTPGATVTFTGGGASSDSGGGDTQTAQSVHVRVMNPYGSYLFNSTVGWFDGMTAYDALRSTGLSVTASGTDYGTYVQKIETYGEMDLGKNSGWVYAVNTAGYSDMDAADYPDVASSETGVDPDSYVLWRYTQDWSTDSYVSGSSGTGTAAGDAATLAPAVTASGGTAAVSLGASDLAAALAGAGDNGGAGVVIAPAISGTVNQVSVGLPTASLSSISGAGAGLTAETPVGSVTIPAAALASVASQAAGTTVTVSLAAVDAGSLTSAQREAVGNGQVYDISIFSNDTRIGRFDGSSITISLPYTLRDGEIADGVTVWYLNGRDELERMACTYDGASGRAVFTTTHLSNYVVGYAEPWENPFSDVAESDWFYSAVRYADQNGLLLGTGDGAFRPDGGMTRAMLAAVLYRLSGKPSAEPGSRYTDVPDGQWYTDAVRWACAGGILTGYGDGRFGTGDNVTREQLASALYRYAAYRNDAVTAAADLSAYTDAGSISVWARDAMAWANAQGLLLGRTATELAPSGTASRAEVAAVLLRFASTAAAT